MGMFKDKATQSIAEVAEAFEKASRNAAWMHDPATEGGQAGPLQPAPVAVTVRVGLLSVVFDGAEDPGEEPAQARELNDWELALMIAAAEQTSRALERERARRIKERQPKATGGPTGPKYGVFSPLFNGL